jgi:hypothetical protein
LQYAPLAIGRSRRVIGTDDADRSADIRRSQPAIAGRAQIDVIAASEELGNQRTQIRAATALRIPPDIGKRPVEQSIMLIRFCVAHCYTPISWFPTRGHPARFIPLPGARLGDRKVAVGRHIAAELFYEPHGNLLKNGRIGRAMVPSILLAAVGAVHQLQEPASSLRTKRRHAEKFQAFNSLTGKTGMDAGGL